MSSDEQLGTVSATERKPKEPVQRVEHYDHDPFPNIGFLRRPWKKGGDVPKCIDCLTIKVETMPSRRAVIGGSVLIHWTKYRFRQIGEETVGLFFNVMSDSVIVDSYDDGVLVEELVQFRLANSVPALASKILSLQAPIT